MGKIGDSLKAGLTGGLVGMSKTPGFMDVIGSLSPLAGVVSGKGVFGELLGKKRKKDALGRDTEEEDDGSPVTKRRGGKVKKMAKGGSVASKRADGCATKGKTKGRFV
jgi:hypothetical protein